MLEKEWLSFGHKFTDRCGFIAGVDAKELSPVFTQFVDCVWQLTQQFPTAFQFNERYLLALHDHAFSCQFGTFVGNCEKDRIDLRSAAGLYLDCRGNKNVILSLLYFFHYGHLQNVYMLAAIALLTLLLSFHIDFTVDLCLNWTIILLVLWCERLPSVCLF